MQDHPNHYGNWDYVTGTVLRGFEELWQESGDERYFNYIKSTVDYVVYENGYISDYNISAYNIDEINEGRMLLLLYQTTGQEHYKTAADLLRSQLEDHPRTSEGGFWHKQIYPWQMWLDGLYMGSPFYAEYSLLFDEPEGFDDVVLQHVLMENHSRDSLTGLLYHGWDESMNQEWSDPVTGQSPSFWGRAIGWYAMALVDVLDYIPEDHEGRDTIISIINRLAEGMFAYQDETGTWWQVIDKAGQQDNYLESSVTCMMVYSMAKAIRKGYISNSYLPDVLRAYHGVINEFITFNSDSTINLIQTCTSAGLGGNPYRDGSYDYYVNQTTISVNDGKGLGPFITGSVEIERMCLPDNLEVQTLSDSGLMLSWDPFPPYFDSLEIFRYNGSDYVAIQTIPATENSFQDTDLFPLTIYRYKIRPVIEGIYGIFSQSVSASTLGMGGTPALPLNPHPANGADEVDISAQLSWQKGEGAEVQKIYFGTSNPPPLAGSQTGSSSFDPEILEEGTTYYWRIDGVNNSGTTEGDLWTFSTKSAPDLIAHWPLDEGTGNILSDVQGNNNAMLFNTDQEAWQTLGEEPYLSLDGVDDYGQVSHQEILNFGANSFSISFWLKQEVQDKAMRYIIKGTHYPPGSGKRYEVFHHQNNQIRFTIDDDQVKTSLSLPNTDFVTGEWVHVVAVRDVVNQSLKLYANTQLKGAINDNTGNISQQEDLFIGLSPDEENNYFEGGINDIRLFNFAIKDSLIQALYSENLPTSNDSELPKQDIKQLNIFPSPADNQVEIRFDITEKTSVKLLIYTPHGRLVSTLLDEIKMPGKYKHNFTTENLPSGIYFVRLDTDQGHQVRKLVIKK